MTGESLPVIEAAGFLLDLDGVLVDSTATVERHWREVATEHGLDAEALLGEVHGRRSADVFRDLAPSLRRPVEDVIADFEHREATDLAGYAALPGAAATLASLPQSCWAIVTSGTKAIATARLSAVGLPHPQLLVTADDVPAGKPDPAPYLHGAKLLGLLPADCLAVEDAPSGVTSALNAGCPTLALLTTHTADQLKSATFTAPDLAHTHLVATR